MNANKSVLLISILLVGSSFAYANEVSQALEQMTEANRAATLALLLKQSGESCDKAVRVFKQGADKDNAVYWNVACANGMTYGIQVADDAAGNTRVMSCELLKMLGIECFKAF